MDPIDANLAFKPTHEIIPRLMIPLRIFENPFEGLLVCPGDSFVPFFHYRKSETFEDIEVNISLPLEDVHVDKSCSGLSKFILISLCYCGGNPFEDILLCIAYILQ